MRGTPYSELGFDLFAPDFAPPHGESWEAFHRRVDVAWRRVLEVAARTPGNLAVVTHGLVCYSLALRHLSLPAGAAPDLRVPNTALALIEPSPPFHVSLWGCTAHLEAATEGGRGLTRCARCSQDPVALEAVRRSTGPRGSGRFPTRRSR